MAFIFTTQQIETLEEMLDDAINGIINFHDVYDEVFEYITAGDPSGPNPVPGVDANGNPADPYVWLWLQGARHINKGEGEYSDFIREYTATQYEIRFGQPLPADAMQNASNEIAKAVVQDSENY